MAGITTAPGAQGGARVIDCPIDFSKLSAKSKQAIGVLAEMAMGALSESKAAGEPIPAFPFEIFLWADKPEVPVAVFYFETPSEESIAEGGDADVTIIYFDETEMFREGRGSTLHVKGRRCSAQGGAAA